MKSKISVVGSLNYDILLSAERLPKRGETYTIDGIEFNPGGKGLNQAFQASNLGITTKFFGCLGDDNFGQYILENVKNDSLDMSQIKVTDVNTGMGIVNILHDGSVFANILPGANFEVDKEYLDEKMEQILDADYIILQLEIPTESVEYIINSAYEKKVKTILNAAPAKDISIESLSKVDILIVNETEAEFYTKCKIDNIENAKTNVSKFKENIGINTIIVTLGDKGSLCFEGKNIEYVPVVKSDKVEDTTGAGDSYIGAFVFALEKGYNVIDACKFASFIASKTISKIGAQAAMPDLEEVKNDTRIKANFNFK